MVPVRVRVRVRVHLAALGGGAPSRAIEGQLLEEGRRQLVPLPRSLARVRLRLRVRVRMRVRARV